MNKTDLSKFDKLRLKFHQDFKMGISPVDGRQPIPDSVAVDIVNELIAAGIDKSAEIGVYDAYLILTTHLVENGFKNITILENTHRNLTTNQEKYYNKVKAICDKQGFVYYTPPMNNYNRCNMKFDVVVGNPPYQNSADSGNKRGSGYKALWYEFANLAINKLVKDGGIVSLITPDSAFSGSNKFTSLLAGEDTEVDLVRVKFGLRKAFNVAIEICRWVAVKSNTPDCITDVDGREVDAKKVFKIYRDEMTQSIMDTLYSYKGKRCKFSVSGQYNYAGVTAMLKKQGKDVSVVRDFSDTQTETHQFKLIDNGKIKYTQVLFGNDYNKNRVFLSRMKNPWVVYVDNNAMNTESTLVMDCKSMEEAEAIKSNLDNEITRNVFKLIVSNGRISGGDLSLLPVAAIEEVLTSDQIAYVRGL